jgi:hypothetical protein
MQWSWRDIRVEHEATQPRLIGSGLPTHFGWAYARQFRFLYTVYGDGSIFLRMKHPNPSVRRLVRADGHEAGNAVREALHRHYAEGE